MAGQQAQNIAICGAGILGLLSAYELVRAGHSVTLYDPAGFPAKSSASYIAGGMLAPYSEIEHMSESWVQAGLDSIARWREIAQELGPLADFGQKGSLFIAHSPDQYMLERFSAHLKDKPHCRIVGGVELEKLEPALAGRFKTGLYLEEEAHLYPARVMELLCAKLAAAGAVFKTEAVEPQNLSGSYDRAIDTRGMAASAQDQDLRGVKGEIVIVRNPEFSLLRPLRLMHPRYPLYIVPRPDHHFMIGATMIESSGRSFTSLRSAMELMSALYSLHPSFGEAEVIDFLSGLRPSYSDNLPRITVQRKSEGNIVRANGSFRHGYLLAPFIASCLRVHLDGKQIEEIPQIIRYEDDDNSDHQRQKAAI